ncbi:chaperone protein dnaJ 20, chloroplastic-like [Vicia villosa]|uniref:chaperone protein dnaJ 20, chloroplastic-like n=1 Tax=Vicia villosa TaxID=3911 RepID=UPI00273B0BC5|nr:chaperone protein dnaJ 20, chloroplastic-like [Vicia villosa]
MDVLLSLNSSLSLINISKPYKHHHNLQHSNNHQRQPRTTHFSVSCRATKNVPINQKLQDDEDGNLYKILSLSPKSATMDDIKRAYRTMALRYHPDVCHDRMKKEESTRMFVKLNEAYKILSNPKLKEEYDCKLFGLDDLRRSRWMEQVVELNRRSHTHRGGASWGSRMRAKNNINIDDHNN